MSGKINAGDGFRLFGSRSEKENARDGQAPDVKKSWFDIFKPNRQKTLVGEGTFFPYRLYVLPAESRVGNTTSELPLRVHITRFFHTQELVLRRTCNKSAQPFHRPALLV